MSDAIPLGSTVVYDRGKGTLMVLTKIANDGLEGRWVNCLLGDTFEISDRKIREFKCFKDLKVAE